MSRAIETKLYAVMDQTVTQETRAYARLNQQIDGTLLEHACTDARLDIVAGMGFDHNGVDSLQVQQMRKHQAGGACSDDSDLRSHQRCAFLGEKIAVKAEIISAEKDF